MDLRVYPRYRIYQTKRVKSECLRTDTGNIIDIIFSQGGIKQPIQAPPWWEEMPMRLCNTDPQINCFTFSHLYVVVQLVWIVAFLVSTKFEHFRCQPPGKISYCCFGAPVLCTGALFCTLFLIRKRLRPYRCRSPPSGFDFCHQLKHRNWRKLLWRKSIFGIITRIIHRTWSFPTIRGIAWFDLGLCRYFSGSNRRESSLCLYQ